MPIEVRCPQCDTLLRVPDGSEGRETSCPSCQAMLSIPSPPTSAVPPADGATAGTTPGAPARSAEQEANPFAAPTAEPQSGLVDGVSPFAGTPPVRLDIGDLLARTFVIFRQNMGSCVAAGAILYYPSLLVLSALFGPVRAIELATGSFLAQPLTPDELPRFLIATLINLPLSMFLITGLAFFSLRLARSGGGPVRLLFSGGRRMLSVLVTYFMFTIAMTIGMVLCCVPGFWIAIVFSQFLWLIVDGRAGILDCFSRSKELTEGHRLNLLWLMLIVGAVSVIAAMVPFAALIMQPIIYPVMMLLGALIYLTLTGQPVAGSRASLPGPVTVAAPGGGATHGPVGDHPEPPASDSTA